MKVLDVLPMEIRDYALSYGWVIVKEALTDGLFVMNSPKNDFRQLIFPVDFSRPDYEEMAGNAINKLSTYLVKSQFQIREEIREVNDDVISLRYYSDSKIVNSISFKEALEAIEATRQMLLSAGSTVVSPKIFHPKLNRTEPQELIKKTRFRHTEEGSFILKISCPVQPVRSIDSSLIWPDEVKPFSRKTFEVIDQSAMLILTAIEQDTLEQFSESQMKSDHPIVSYNLCDSMIDLFDDDRELPFELKFDWSRGFAKEIPSPQSRNAYKFPYDFKSKLEWLKSYFGPRIEEINDTFYGTVEELKGDESGGMGRSGEVILTLLVGSEKITVRVNLSVDHYKIAIKAHETIGTYVRVKGRLHPGKRVRTLDNISSFEFAEK